MRIKITGMISADAILALADWHARNTTLLRLITEPNSQRAAECKRQNAAIEEVLALAGWVRA
jgi:hypothetical protein